VSVTSLPRRAKWPSKVNAQRVGSRSCAKKSISSKRVASEALDRELGLVSEAPGLLPVPFGGSATGFNFSWIARRTSSGPKLVVSFPSRKTSMPTPGSDAPPAW
jgi:hypothetical protein